MKAFTAAVVATIASSALAFAPASTSHGSSTSLKAGMPDRLWDSMVDKTQRSRSVPFLPRPINLDGSLPGDQGFDPFYLSSIPKNFAGFLQPPSWEDVGEGLPTIYWMAESEIKHGRIAMLAVVGWIATDFGLRLPASQFADVPNSYNAHNILVDQGAMGFMLFAIGLVEMTTGACLVQVAKGELEREPGYFGFGSKVLDGKTEAQAKEMKTKEINNGRLAMLAFGGIATQTALGHESFPYF